MFIRNIISLFILQVILLAVPIFNSSIVVNITCFIINVLGTFLIIKLVEKQYYKKYNKINSLLYNLCPLLGVSIIFIIVYRICKLEMLDYLMKYYICLFLSVYLFNIVYIIEEYLKKLLKKYL